jgi:hypothetical protein
VSQDFAVCHRVAVKAVSGDRPADDDGGQDDGGDHVSGLLSMRQQFTQRCIDTVQASIQR